MFVVVTLETTRHVYLSTRLSVFPPKHFMQDHWHESLRTQECVTCCNGGLGPGRWFVVVLQDFLMFAPGCGVTLNIWM